MNYDSDYEIRLATLEAMGGDISKHYDSVYDIDLAILKLTEEGGGGGSAYTAGSGITISSNTVSVSSNLFTTINGKANKVDYIIPVTTSAGGYTSDFSVLDNITADEGIYNLQFNLVLGNTSTVLSYGILIVGAGGQTQTICYFEAPCMKYCTRLFMGTWMTVEEGSQPCLWFDGAPNKTNYTYSADKVDNLLSALETRIYNLEHPNS